jgi:RNA polymerase sigma-70 factor (ECF subfamily)
VPLSELGESALDFLRREDARAEPDARPAAELLGVAMNALSPTDRVVLTLLELEGRSVKEVAALLGASAVAVRVRALRARARLRKALEKLLAEER